MVTLDEFKIIFNRFPDCPGGLYHEPSDIGYDIYNFDQYDEKTYCEMLIEYYTEEYVRKLINHDGSEYRNDDEIYNFMEKSGYELKEYIKIGY